MLHANINNNDSCSCHYHLKILHSICILLFIYLFCIIEKKTPRLGLSNNSPTARNPLPPVPSSSSSSKSTKEKDVKRSHHRSSEERHALPLPPPPSNSNGKRFDSSLGSDTGTSTRESDEGSEERTSVDLSPTQPSIFDSLAAELRAKLNGNGPPLLLPPRDYDTMHRSKGNLAAIELRRCRNKLIVGATTNGEVNKKLGVSSRGSSGIGSDLGVPSPLAPSPERQEGQSSSGLFFICTRRSFSIISKIINEYIEKNL